MVSEALVRRYFTGRNPIGVSIAVAEWDAALTATIVGVVGDARYGSLREAAEPVLYLPAAQWTAWPFVVVSVQTPNEPEVIVAQLRREIATHFPELRVERLMALEESLDAALARERLAAGLAVVFAVVALGLVMVGLFGVVSYRVSRQIPEIGVRMALGTRR